MNTSYLRKVVCFGLSLLVMLSPAFVVGVAQADSPKSATYDVENSNLPGGTSISVAIDSPADGAVFASGNISVSGTASVGTGVPVANTALVYVLDVSGSTDDPSAPGCAGDQNGDGRSNRILDCEIRAARLLNNFAQSTGTIGDVGVAVFADAGAAADVGPVAGDQLITGPTTDADGNGIRDVGEVLSSAFSDVGGGNGGVQKFTPKTVGQLTSFSAGIQAALDILSASSEPNKMVVFMSDGQNNAGVNVSSLLVPPPPGVKFFTFAVGDLASCTAPNSLGTLQNIADLTGGTCTAVSSDNIESLLNILPSVVASKLTFLERQLDGGGFTTFLDPSPDLTGPVSAPYNYQLNGLAPGAHEICVRAHGSDGGGEGSVTDCHTIKVVDLTLTPPTATNELGTPGQTHTVTATVAAGVVGGVSGLTVNFEILSGPNAGMTGSGITDSNGQATFTYAGIQGLLGRGQDVIEACFGPDMQGDSVCDTATKDWVDTTPPIAACVPTTNPSGRNIPSAGNNRRSGQNPDGFYELTVTDLVDPNPQIFIHDSGSSFVAGPYDNGTKIKLIQAPGARPNVRPGTGVIDWKITLKGDALLIAVDSSGNASIPVWCRVSPPPK